MACLLLFCAAGGGEAEKGWRVKRDCKPLACGLGRKFSGESIAYQDAYHSRLRRDDRADVQCATTRTISGSTCRSCGGSLLLVAVLTAIPVVMWTITAFVRSHIGPPRAPDLRPMAIAPTSPPATATAAAAASDQSPTQSADTAQGVPSSASAYAPTNDAAAAPVTNAGGASPADTTPTGATPTLKTASVAPSAATPDDTPAAAAPPPEASGSADGGGANPADSAAPDQSSDNGGTQVAARPQDSVWPAPPAAAAAGDDLPPGQPISGPVPLPRKRPTSFAMAGNIPLPAPRPEAAGGGAPEPQPTPIDWLKKVFHSSAPPAPSPDGGDDTAHE